MDRRKQRFKKRTAVTKEQALNFLCANEAAEQNREAHQCGKRNSNGITQPSGAATPRDSDTHKRIAVPQAFCVLRECLRPRPKSGKVCRSDTRPGDVCERAERSEGSDTTPSETPPVSPCKPLCARLGAGGACVYPPQPLETNVAAFVPEVLKAVRPMCWKRWYDCVSCAFAAFPRTKKKAG